MGANIGQVYLIGLLIGCWAAFVVNMNNRESKGKLYTKRAIFWPLTVAHFLYWLIVEDGNA